MCPIRQYRRAFTLVELLVVVTIIGLLIALLLPAVQSAREAARQTQCSNNLKQIGLAFHVYHKSHNVFPPSYVIQPGGGGLNGTPDPVTRDAGPGWAWGAMLLPYLEQGPLYDLLDFGRPCWDEQNRVGYEELIPGQPVEVPLVGRQLKVFLCPSANGTEEPVKVVDASGTTLATFGRLDYRPPGGQLRGHRRRSALPQRQNASRQRHRRAFQHGVRGGTSSHTQRQDLGRRCSGGTDLP